MKRLRITLIVFVVAVSCFVAGNNSRPVEPMAIAQATNARGNWINNERTATNALILSCQNIVSLDNEYVANGYGAALVNGDFVGANSGITAAQMVTAEGNLMKVCTAMLGTAASFPVSIATGTNTTIFLIR